MDNIIIVTDSESDSDYSDSRSDHDEREEVVYENTHFMNHVETEEYKKNRNQLFTKDIETRSLLVDTNNIQKTSNFNTNDYTYNLFSENNNTDQNTTGGYDSYKNVIGFRLIRAIIPNTAYTINDMNNSAYIDTFFSYLCSNLTQNDVLPSFPIFMVLLMELKVPLIMIYPMNIMILNMKIGFTRI